MADFPNIPAPSSIKPIKTNAALVSNADAGYKISRMKFTRVVNGFELTWAVIKTVDYEQLEAFFDSVNCTDVFNWTHPLSKKSYQVRFLEPISFQSKEINWTGAVKLETV